MRLPRYRVSHIAAAGLGRAALGQAGSVCRVPERPAAVGWALGVLECLGLWVPVAQSCWEEQDEDFLSLTRAFGESDQW